MDRVVDTAMREHYILNQLKHHHHPDLDTRYGSVAQKFAEAVARDPHPLIMMLDLVMTDGQVAFHSERVQTLWDDIAKNVNIASDPSFPHDHLAILGLNTLKSYRIQEPRVAFTPASSRPLVKAGGHPYRVGYLQAPTTRPVPMLMRLLRKIPCVFGIHRWEVSDSIVPSKWPCHCVYCGAKKNFQ